MKTDPRHAEQLRQALHRWVEEGLLPPEKARELDASIEVVPVNWRKITQLAFVIALASAVQKLRGTATRPTPDSLAAISRKWKPWRSVAARILWHYYLSMGK